MNELYWGNDATQLQIWIFKGGGFESKTAAFLALRTILHILFAEPLHGGGVHLLVAALYRYGDSFPSFDAQAHDSHQFGGGSRFSALGDRDGTVQRFCELR